ncbi:hypothetical protein [Hyalangium rubrum]|uniref:Cytochrome c domain-containing protein n=1 Tax=Hyalangium rubrum TaxID=3103134 RepID=A0ABU5H3Z7_9BACT|nr:hypothetical protein [Hyalangium sp. s54d21]MDY7227533.1 hypothetical protein [Hyalangium sp. s54d21]
MLPRSLPRLCLFVVTATLCLGHGDDGGCGGGGEEEHHHEGSSGATCPSAGAPTAQDFGSAFMERYCLSCHSASLTGRARRDAPEGMNFDTLEEVRRQAAAIDSHAAAGPNGVHSAMPPVSTPQPTRQERERLGQWLACGAP